MLYIVPVILVDCNISKIVDVIKADHNNSKVVDVIYLDSKCNITNCCLTPDVTVVVRCSCLERYTKTLERKTQYEVSPVCGEELKWRWNHCSAK